MVLTESAAFDGARIGLHCDLSIVGDLEVFARSRQYPPDRFGGKQAGRSATQEDAADLATANFGGLKLNVLLERANITVFLERAMQGVGVEIAIRTFAHEPG